MKIINVSDLTIEAQLYLKKEFFGAVRVPVNDSYPILCQSGRFTLKCIDSISGEQLAERYPCECLDTYIFKKGESDYAIVKG